MKLFINKHIIFLLLFSFIANMLYPQNNILGYIADEDENVLPSATLLLYNTNDTINYLKGTQSDIDGHFLFEDIEDGDYILKISMVGMLPKNIPLSVASKDINLRNVTILTDINQLEEVMVKKKIPERKIEIPPRDNSSVSDYAMNHIKRIDGSHIYNDKNHSLSRFDGKWQWISADGDSIFTVILEDTEIENTRKYGIGNRDFSRPRHSQEIRIIHRINRMFGRYEYQIKDSIIYSNIDSKVKFNSSFFQSFSDDKRFYLIGPSEQPYHLGSNQIILWLDKNPIGKERAFITFMILTNRQKEEFLFVKVDVLKKRGNNSVTVRDAFPYEFMFPTKMIMRKIKPEKNKKK